jgi:glycosyltransferase involved in cell wall biosynthesis
LGLEGFVTAPGYLEDAHLLDTLSAFDAIVLPYDRAPIGHRRFVASLSAAAYDAVRAGVPVVCSGARVIGDLVVDGGNGLVYDDDDGNTLVAALRRLAAEPELLYRVRAGASQSRSQLTGRDAGRTLHGLYREVLPGAGAGSALRVTWICLERPRRDQHGGGVGRYAFRLAELISHEVQLTVIARAGAVQLKGVNVVELPPSRGRLGRYYVDPFRLRRVVATVPADLVHAFGDDWAVGRRHKLRTFHGSALGEAMHSTGLRAWNHYLLALTELVAAKRSELRVGVATESARRFRAHAIMPPILDNSLIGTGPKTADPSVIFIGSFGGRKRGWLPAHS